MACLWQGENLISVSLSGNINYLNFNDASTDRPILRTIKGHTKSITALEVAHVNTTSPILFSGSHDGLIIHWDATTGEMDSVQPGTVGPHKNQVQDMKFDPASALLVTCGLDDTVRFIDDYKYMFAL